MSSYYSSQRNRKVNERKVKGNCSIMVPDVWRDSLITAQETIEAKSWKVTKVGKRHAITDPDGNVLRGRYKTFVNAMKKIESLKKERSKVEILMKEESN